MNSEVISLPLDRILVGKRLRAIDYDYATMLAGSMQKNGQHTPIHVGPADADGMHRLIAGGHRHAAAKMAGIATLTAVVFEGSELEQDLLEIDENLLRRELSELDRAVFLAKRRDIYEALYPETSHGKASKKSKAEENFHFARPEAFAAATAQKLGVSDRQVRTYLARATKIEPDLRDLLASTRWADHGSTLDGLVRLTPEKRRVAVLALTRAEAPAPNFAAARAEADGVRESVNSEADTQLRRLNDAWRKATKPRVRENFVRGLLMERANVGLLRGLLAALDGGDADEARVTRALGAAAQGRADEGDL